MRIRRPCWGARPQPSSCDLDYFAIANAFRTGIGLAGTIEFFPEEGKYHLDGHRKCGIRFEPERSDEHGGMCPACGKPLTIGVLHRVAELADRPAGYRPPGAPGFANLVQLRQIIGEIAGVGPASKKVAAEAGRLIGVLGPELGILCDVPLSEVQRAGGTVLAEAVARLRRGEVAREAGYDGEYGKVALFAPGELESAATLFDLPAAEAQVQAGPAAGGPAAGLSPAGAGAGARGGEGDGGGGAEETGVGPDGALAQVPRPRTATEPTGPLAGLLAQLDPDQRAAAEAASPLMIVAGPGAGKTRTLTYRIALRLAATGLPAQACLAVTFTRRAAEEMRARLRALSAAAGRDLSAVTVTTFHGLGLLILRELHAEAGLPADFQVTDEAALEAVATELAGSAAAGREPAQDRRSRPGEPRGAGQGADRARPRRLRRPHRAARPGCWPPRPRPPPGCAGAGR